MKGPLLPLLFLWVGVVVLIGGKKWSGQDHGHGHGWMKLHSSEHHDASSKLSEAYVKFHRLGDGQTKGQRPAKGGILGSLFSGGGGGNAGNSNHGGGGDMMGGVSGGSDGWAAPQTLIPVQMIMGGGGGGGWGAVMEMAPSQMMGWSSSGGMMSGGGGGGWGEMSMGGGGGHGGGMIAARPTGWASAGGGMGPVVMMQTQQMQPASGWATGSFGKFRPGASTSQRGTFNFELPNGKPAILHKLKPIIDLPKKGWGRR